MSMETVKKNRKFTRFKPDPLTIAFLDYGPQNAFVPEEVGLIVNESYTGCALVYQTNEKPEKGTYVKIKVGRIKPLRAQVIWGKKLDEGVFKIGFQYLE